MVPTTNPGFTDLGTWQTSHLGIDSNVAILARAISPQSTVDNIVQMVYYQRGVGTSVSKWDNIMGGMFGRGVGDNVRDAYLFVALNYCHGDEIYLFGFSRGAYTVRTIAHIICEFGVLTKRDNYVGCTAGFDEVYKNFKAGSQDWVASLRVKYDPICDATIKFVGLWDMVGSLGISETRSLGEKHTRISLLMRGLLGYRIADEAVPTKIDYVCHAYYPLTL
jgi:uncharacterized protein (DUF2235 family)